MMRRGAVAEGEQGSKLARGALCLTLACTGLVLSAVVVRSLGPGVDPVHIIFLQNLVSTLIVMGISFRNPAALRTSSGTLKHILRGCFVGVALYLGYYSLQQISVADFTAIVSVRMAVTTVLGWLFLREVVSGRLWVAVACATVGVVVFLAPTGDGDVLHVGAAVLSMICVSVATIMLRFMKSERWQAMLFSQSAVVAIGTGFIIVAKRDNISEELIAPGVILGILAWGIQRLTVEAYKSAQASSLQPFDASRILVALALDFAVFMVVPNFYSALGASIIMLSMLLVLLPVGDLMKRSKGRCKKNLT